MKKTLLFSFLILFISAFSFAISDITLHRDGDDIVIKKNKIYLYDENIGEIINENILKLYDEEDNKTTIYEDEKFLYMITKYDTDLFDKRETKFSKATGNLVFVTDGFNYAAYDEVTGLTVNTNVIYVFENEYESTERFYNEEETVIKEIVTKGIIINNDLNNIKKEEIIISEYNDDGIQTHETCYNGENNFLYEIEFDNDGNRTKEKDYDEQNTIICEIIFKTTKTSNNSRINEEIQRRRFNKKTKEFETWEKITGEEIIIENNIYLCTEAKETTFNKIEKSVDKIIKWDNNNFAKIKKIDITKINEYKFLEKLQNQKNYIGRKFYIRNDNTNIHYYINYDLDNFKIDLNSCFEIQIIDRPFSNAFRPASAFHTLYLCICSNSYNTSFALLLFVLKNIYGA